MKKVIKFAKNGIYILRLASVGRFRFSSLGDIEVEAFSDVNGEIVKDRKNMEADLRKAYIKLANRYGKKTECVDSQ